MITIWQVALFCPSLLGAAWAELPTWPTKTSVSTTAHQSPAPAIHDETRLARKRDTWATGSVCGFVTQDAHHPLACPESQFCTSSDHQWQCCSNLTPMTSVVTGARSYNFTYTGYANCSPLGPSTCYDLNHTAQCSGTCASTANVCKNRNYPYCASLTSSVIVGNITSDYTVAFCDTTSYVLPVVPFASAYMTVADTSIPSGVTFTFARPSGTSLSTSPTTSTGFSITQRIEHVVLLAATCSIIVASMLL